MVRVPLEEVHVPGVARTSAKAVLSLLVLSRQRRWVSLSFVVDSGCAVTTIPLTVALEKRLEVPSRALDTRVWTAAGKVKQRRRPGHVTVRIPGLERREFVWPCHFVEHLGVPPKPALGLAGVLDDLVLTFDGTYGEGEPYGALVIEPVTVPRR